MATTCWRAKFICMHDIFFSVDSFLVESKAPLMLFPWRRLLAAASAYLQQTSNANDLEVECLMATPRRV